MSAETEDPAAQREETEHERLTRNVNELLQELRVAQAGVQFLFGFLLAVAFTEPYARATDFQHVVHLIAVLFATAAVALLSGPAAWHRVLFRQGERKMIIDVANRFAIAGMVCLAIAMTFTVLLLVNEVLGNWGGGIALWGAIVVSALAGLLFLVLWFLLPLRHRLRNDNGNDNGNGNRPD